MNYELYYTIVTYVLFGVIGLCVGSFLNVVIYRLPLGMSLANPPSHCTSCGYKLKAYDNIPIISYLLLRGKCRKCGEKISPRYILVELLCMILWLLLPTMYGTDCIPYISAAAVAISALICIFFIDLEHMIIPDTLNLTVAIMGVAAIFLDPYTEWYDHLIGAASAFIIFLAVYYLSRLILGREGIGFGDVKLSFAMGLLLGWQRLIFALLVGTVLASVILITVRRVRHDDKMTEYPLGPFLAFGTVISLLFGANVIDWYISILL